MKKKIAVAFASAAAVLVLCTGCLDKQTEQFKDSQRGQTNGTPADLVTFPDGFNNLATKCDHGNRLYVTFHGDGAYGSVTVVPKDPTC